MSAAFRAAEGQPRVGTDDGVDEQCAGLDLASEPEAALYVASPNARPEPVASVIRELDGVRLVARSNDGRDRTEGLFGEDRHIRGDVGQDRRCVEAAWPVEGGSAEQDTGP